MPKTKPTKARRKHVKFSGGNFPGSSGVESRMREYLLEEVEMIRKNIQQIREMLDKLEEKCEQKAIEDKIEEWQRNELNRYLEG